MPVKYVGGKMMVVRAMTQGLDLIWNTPSLTPMKGLREPPVFTAMTPMQATAALADPDERELLKGHPAYPFRRERRKLHACRSGSGLSQRRVVNLRDDGNGFAYCLEAPFG